MIIDLTDPMSIEAAKMYCNKQDVLWVGVTSGCFDLLSYYHLIYLLRCKQACDVLVVGVDSDRKIRDEKGADRPIVNERHRLALVNALKCVDGCFMLDSLDQFGNVCATLIRKKEYGLIFRNQEWAGREKDVVTGGSGARVVIVPDIEEITSTTDMVKRIRAQVGED
jgi:cytidyltransferase-like protein